MSLEKLKIKYKKKRLYVNLFVALIWLAFGAFYLLQEEKLSWVDYGYWALALMYLSQFFYEYANQYITIENGVIKKHGILQKALKLHEIESIKMFAGDYILKTQSKSLRIDTKIIEKASLNELNNVFEKLKVSKNSAVVHS